MQMKRNSLRVAIGFAIMAVAGIAQACGVDVPAFLQANAGAAAGLAVLGFAGEMDVKGVQEALAKIGDQVKEAGEKALAEAQRGIKLTEAEKARIDELLVKQGETQNALREVQQKLEAAGAAANAGQKSIGQQVVENPDFKSRMDEFRGQRKGSMAFQVKAITSASNSAGQGVYPDNRPGVFTLPNRRLTIRDLVAPGRTNSNLVRYVKETGFTNSAATVLEGTRKPESSITYALSDASVKKIAHFIKASTEILDDFPALQSQIDERLRYGLAFAEEAQLLKGSGVGNNLNGIYTQASAFVAPAGTTTVGATRIDVLRLALLQAELAEYPSDGLVLHPTDWALIELTKDTQGRYIIGNPQGSIDAQLWGRRVVATQAMTQDTFLAGAFRLGAQIFDREDANVVIATENEDDFVNNLVTILAEERLAMAVYRPEAFVKGDLTPA